MLDPATGRFLDINEKGCTDLGYRREQLLEMSVFDIDPLVTPASYAIYLEKMRGAGAIAFQSQHRRADGTTFPVEISCRLVRLGREYIVTAVRDISERLQSETTRRSLEMQLMQSQKMEAIGLLAGGVAHDFNNLLTVILGFSELVLDKLPADDDLVQPVRAIKDAGERGAALTRQMLVFSRSHIFDFKLLDLNSVVSETETMLRRLIPEDIDFRVDLDPAIGRVRADPGQLGQVLINLVVNARDAMPDGGRLTIETRSQSAAP